MGESWLITYKKLRGKEERLIELGSEKKLLDWIAKNASGCSLVLIQKVKEA